LNVNSRKNGSKQNNIVVGDKTEMQINKSVKNILWLNWLKL